MLGVLELQMHRISRWMQDDRIWKAVADVPVHVSGIRVPSCCEIDRMLARIIQRGVVIGTVQPMISQMPFWYAEMRNVEDVVVYDAGTRARP